LAIEIINHIEQATPSADGQPSCIKQLKDAVQFLSQLVPFIIDIMIDNPKALWGDAHYPLING